MTVPKPSKGSNPPRNKKRHFKKINSRLEWFINFDRRLRLEALLSDFKGAKNWVELNTYRPRSPLLRSHPTLRYSAANSLERAQCITMLLWKIHSEFVQDFSRVSLKGSKECTATIYYDKAKLAVVRKQCCESLEQKTTVSAASTSLLRILVQKGYQKQYSSINLSSIGAHCCFFTNKLEEEQQIQELWWPLLTVSHNATKSRRKTDV